MGVFILTVILTAIAVGLSEALSPDGNGIEKYVKFIGMLIILIAVLNPIISLVSQMEGGILDSVKDKIIDAEFESESYEDILNEYLLNNSVSQLEDKLYELLENDFGIPCGDAEIVISTFRSEDKVGISNLQILLSGRSIFKNPYLIEEKFNELIGCDVQVLIANK